jgi:hypothetical protein
MNTDTLTAEEARELLEYIPLTGDFFWRVTRNNRTKAGTRAGAVEAQGYTVIKIDGRTYKAHRLAWLITYGQWPENQIDHIDRCRANDRLSNLREVSISTNCRNRGARTDNTSGVPGVHKHGGKWQARIATDTGRISLGHFASMDDAIQARRDAELKYGYLSSVKGAAYAHDVA